MRTHQGLWNRGMLAHIGRAAGVLALVLLVARWVFEVPLAGAPKGVRDALHGGVGLVCVYMGGYAFRLSWLMANADAAALAAQARRALEDAR